MSASAKLRTLSFDPEGGLPTYVSRDDLTCCPTCAEYAAPAAVALAFALPELVALAEAAEMVAWVYVAGGNRYLAQANLRDACGALEEKLP